MYIKREDAINELCNNCTVGDFQYGVCCYEFNGECKEVNGIKDIPSADVVERKRGEWILTPYTDCGSPVYECSVCTHGVSGDLQVRNFCPNCGAEMREREGE